MSDCGAILGAGRRGVFMGGHVMVFTWIGGDRRMVRGEMRGYRGRAKCHMDVTGERTSHVVHAVVGCIFLLVLGLLDVYPIIVFFANQINLTGQLLTGSTRYSQVTLCTPGTHCSQYSVLLRATCTDLIQSINIEQHTVLALINILAGSIRWSHATNKS